MYIAFILNSKLLKYWMLLTSGKFGVERDAWNDEDYLNFPVIELNKLDINHRNSLQRLHSMAMRDMDVDLAEIDNFIYSLYGIGEAQRHVIADTLSVSLPMTFAKKNAQRKPTSEEIEKFVTLVSEIATPIMNLMGGQYQFAVRHDLNSKLSPWIYFEIYSKKRIPPLIKGNLAEALAEKEGCSQIFWKLDECVVVGLRAQYRYWILSRAQLISDSLLRQLWG
jgi:hypothetical protein